MAFPIAPPVDPMLAKLATTLPEGEGWLFEPKWDGFRAIVFRDGSEVYIQSRDLKPLDRYFPELKPALLASLPPRAVVDGEIVIATDHGLDFDLLQLRLHPAASRVAKLAEETPSASRSKATKPAGELSASFATREAAGCRRSCSASKSRPRGPAITISPSTTQRRGKACTKARASSGK